MASDAGLTYFLPTLSFLLVWIVVFAFLHKTEFANKFWQFFLSLVIAAIFISFTGARTFVTNIVPWFAVLIVCLFMIMALTGFIGGDMSFMNKWIGTIFLIILVAGFLVSAVFIFSSSMNKYLPVSSQAVGEDSAKSIFSWFFTNQIFGVILLIIISWIVAWVLIRS